MTLGPLFIGAKARCKEHPSVVLDLDEEKCLACRIVQRNLDMKPPFDVLCVDARWGFVKGKKYKVFWVLKEATNEYGRARQGYVFKDEHNNIKDTIMDTEWFIPVLYLNDDEEDEWTVGEEQEWDQEDEKDREFQQIADVITSATNEQGLENIG